MNVVRNTFWLKLIIITFSNNKPPSQASYYGDNNIFTNFRDFADIKGDAKQYNGYDEGYYYR